VATLILELDEKGPVVWQRFKAGAEASLWFYDAVSKAVTHRLGPTHPLSTELTHQVEALAKKIGTGTP
jgi:hypothetical protein